MLGKIAVQLSRHRSLLKDRHGFINLDGAGKPGNASGKLNQFTFFVEPIESPAEGPGIPFSVRSHGRSVESIGDSFRQEWFIGRKPGRGGGRRRHRHRGLRGGSPADGARFRFPEEIHHMIDGIEHGHNCSSRDVPGEGRERR